MSTATTTSLAGELWEVWEKRTLIRALPHLVHNRPAQVAPIPRGMGETIKWRKFGELPTVSSALTEGVTPAPHEPDVTTIQATMQFYGAYLTHTDKLEYTAFDPVIQHFNDILGEQCGRSIDLLTRSEMVSGFTTNVVRPGAYTADNQITSNDLLDYDLLAKGIATLGAANAQPSEGPDYMLILHWHTWKDLYADPVIRDLFVADNPTSATNPFRTGRLGRLLNTAVYVTSHAYFNVDAGASNADVYTSFLIGREALGVSGLSGFLPNMPNVATPDNMFGGMTGSSIKPVQIILKDLGSAGAADPLNQRATAAWKAAHVAKTLQGGFAVAIRHATSMGG